MLAGVHRPAENRANRSGLRPARAELAVSLYCAVVGGLALGSAWLVTKAVGGRIGELPRVTLFVAIAVSASLLAGYQADPVIRRLAPRRPDPVDRPRHQG